MPNATWPVYPRLTARDPSRYTASNGSTLERWVAVAVTRAATDAWEDAPAIALAGAKAAEQAAQLSQSLHLCGIRDTHRALLIEAKVALEAALSIDALTAQSQSSHDSAWLAACRETLAGVYASFARDARYGAGQLSRAAQRAPSVADCEDGWERVAEIVRGAEDVAERAGTLVSERDAPALHEFVDETQRSAQAARVIVESRNHAYTFHANPSFSFGEGWYAAAAATLERISLQIEPGQKHSAAAERFLVGAGLGEQLSAYRPRPRANKALPLIVADAFRRDPIAARARVRAAFLAPSEVVPLVHEWLRARLPVLKGPTVLVWNRQCRHDPHRNSAYDELVVLCRLAHHANLCPILIGDGIGERPLPSETVDLTLFWKEPLFQGTDMRRAQLELFEHLRNEFHLVGQVGVTTAGMDGPALLGLPTMYLTDQPNVRLGRWVGAVPGYEEVRRDGKHVEHIQTRLGEWATRSANANSRDRANGG